MENKENNKSLLTNIPSFVRYFSFKDDENIRISAYFILNEITFVLQIKKNIVWTNYMMEKVIFVDFDKNDDIVLKENEYFVNNFDIGDFIEKIYTNYQKKIEIEKHFEKLLFRKNNIIEFVEYNDNNVNEKQTPDLPYTNL